MATLASATLDTAKLITRVRIGTATGGSTTTLVDTARTEPADHWNEGVIWFLSGNNSGKSARITDYASGGTFTFATQSGACAAGDRYAAIPGDYPQDVLRWAVNQALKLDFPGPPAENVTLTTTADQEDYTLPSGVYNLLRVEIATNTEAPYEYAVHHHWKEMSGELRFDTGMAPADDDLIVRLIYSVPPAELTTDTTAIDDRIHPEALAWSAAVHALRYRVELTEEDKPHVVRKLNEALAMAGAMRSRYPIPEVKRDAHFAAW
jgi:hypothetical protein